MWPRSWLKAPIRYSYETWRVETFHYILSPKVHAYISILQQTLLRFNECGASDPNSKYSHGASEVNMVTLTQFYSGKCEGLFFLERISKTIWRLWTLSPSIGRVLLFVPFFFSLLFLFWLLTLLSLRECKAVGMIIKCCVAGFRLFVYSFASIILNKLPLETRLVSWDMIVLRGSRSAGATY